MTLCLVGVITGTVVGGAFLLYIQNHLDTSVDDFELMAQDRDTTTMISYVDDEGNIVELSEERLSASENRVWVDLDDMSEYLPQAFIAVEDKRFESHDGVDWIRTARVTLDFFLGNGMAGGSTITQQLIKNITGDDDVSIQRKVQEIFRALNLEKQYDKTQILEMYLNNVYLSQGCYGVGAAAYAYFGKEVSELTLIESAAIAAITQNPSYWDPFIYPENNDDRRNYIIRQMYEQGRITQEEYAASYNQELILTPPGADDDGGYNVHSWYTDAAQQEAISLLMQEFGYTASVAEKLLLTSGFNIVTAQDPDVQAVLEKYYEDTENAIWQRKDESPIQPESAAVVIDPNNGNVVGLIGARGQKNGNLLLNYATQTKRPAGSSIKPVAVYGPALEAGVITYATVFDDTPVTFGNRYVDPETGEVSYSSPNGYPQNSPRAYNGLTNVAHGLRVSKNTISWRVLEQLGLQNSFDFLTQKLGYSTLVSSMTNSAGYVFTDIAYAPLAMGEFTYGVTVKEVTSSYQIFANGGIFNEERIVLKILDADGNVILDNEKKSEIVMSAQNASIMTKLLQNVLGTGGTASSGIPLKRTVNCAGKTGTTENNRDRWFVGYTPYYVCGVWFGYAMPRSLDKYDPNNTVPMQVWNAVMTEITKKYVDEAAAGGEPLKTFSAAPGVLDNVTYCKDSGKLMTEACKKDPRGSRSEIGSFVSGTEPTEYCDVHVLVDFDDETDRIAVSGCYDEGRVVQIALLNVLRTFPVNVQIYDAAYTYQVVAEDYSYEGFELDKYPFYQNLLPNGFYAGYTKGNTFNYLCTLHHREEVIETETGTVTEPGVLPVLNASVLPGQDYVWEFPLP